jgi:hypothetical protein
MSNNYKEKWRRERPPIQGIIASYNIHSTAEIQHLLTDTAQPHIL